MSHFDWVTHVCLWFSVASSLLLIHLNGRFIRHLNRSMDLNDRVLNLNGKIVKQSLELVVENQRLKKALEEKDWRGF